ncbi:hypothetical protein BKH46_00745 [Helicobacter sp. 12S02634-8]|nr:hypothetical protein BKH46_00745 [Helicobacter sp. 12S02634-8]
MIEFKEVKDSKECAEVARLAKEIWEEHYATILSPAQIRYMLENFQSTQAISNQIKEGYRYLMIFKAKQLAGYCALKLMCDPLCVPSGQSTDDQCKKTLEGKEIFLSKLYIQKSYRAQGIAKVLFQNIQTLAQAPQARLVWLSVNKHNTHSIQAYQKLGFAIYREEGVSIGQGYVMDDYYMQMLL